ncbi:hypothetical protein [Mesorhizobium sp. YR577]|uniref:hypothetical protein n=1 Tax=Mesorhizobium sp. YR577 TaxID=1884373 RepID=UPI0008F02CB2|nr:hypothetical protein [Mesorhizobium sp. YR577]SFU10949.1 hypothetical protein SAMN05518861_11351 [Mesorhizobium sp. YR577]
MPNFSVSSPKLRVRPLAEADLAPVKRMGRGPSLEHLTYASGPREFGARNATAGAAAALFRQGSEALNEYALTHALKVWLENNEAKIVAEMSASGSQAFVVQVNYAVTPSFETRVFMGRGIYLLGYAPSRSDVSKILTPERLYGPSVDATPSNRATKYVYAYLVGERTVH